MLRFRHLVGLSFLTGAGLSAGAMGACRRTESDEGEGGSSSSKTSTAAFDVPDGGAICGDELHEAATKRPLLYFVLDRSGSMADEGANGESRYTIMREATGELIGSLGALVRVGAALFPSESESCGAGEEVMEITEGSPTGSTGKAFLQATDINPSGGTPTAATLVALQPKFAVDFEDPEGPTAVVLVTDGGPNCNEETTCDPDACIPNITGECPPSIDNCCVAPEGTPGNCLDRGPTLTAIDAVVELGASVYVVGLAVGKPFEVTLNQMALAGNAPRETLPFYYQVDDVSVLGEALREIAAELVSCEFTLADPPTEQGLTNVYGDGKVILQDATNGWVWTDEDTITLVGDACYALKHGSIGALQIVSGCPTEIPK